MNLVICFKTGSVSLLSKRVVFDASKFTAEQQKTEAKEIKERITKGKIDPAGPEGKVKAILKELADIQKKVSTLGKKVKTDFVEHLKTLKVNDGSNEVEIVKSDLTEANAQEKVNDLLNKVTDANVEKNAKILCTLDGDLDAVLLRVKFRRIMADVLGNLTFPGGADTSKTTKESLGTLLEDQLNGTREIMVDGAKVQIGEAEIGKEFEQSEQQFKLRVEALWEAMKFARMKQICESRSADSIDRPTLILDENLSIAYPKKVSHRTEVAIFNYWMEGGQLFAVDNLYGRVQRYNPYKNGDTKSAGAGDNAWVWVDDDKGSDAGYKIEKHVRLTPDQIEAYKKKVNDSVQDDAPGTPGGLTRVQKLERLMNNQRYERLFISGKSRNYDPNDAGNFKEDQDALQQLFTKTFEDLRTKHGAAYRTAGEIGKAGSYYGFASLQMFDAMNLGAPSGFTLPKFEIGDIATTLPAGAPKPPKKDKDKAKSELITKWNEIVEGLKSETLPWGDEKFNASDKHKICRMKQAKAGTSFDIERAEINDTIANKDIFKVENGNLIVDATAVGREVVFKKGQRIDLWIQEKDGAKKTGKKKLLTLIIGEALTANIFELPIRLPQDVEWQKDTKLYIAHQGKFAAGSKLLELEALPPGVSVEITMDDGSALAAAEYTKTADGTITTVKERVPQTEAKFKLKFMKGGSELYNQNITVQVGYPKLRDDDLKFNLIAPTLERGSIVNNTEFYVGKLVSEREGVGHEILVQVKANNGQLRDGGKLTYDTATKYYKYTTNSQLEIGETLVLKPKATLTDDPSQTRNGTVTEIAIQKERTNSETLQTSRNEIEVDSLTLDLNAAGVSPFELFQIPGFHSDDFQPGATITATYNGVTYSIQRNLFESGTKVFLVKNSVAGAVNILTVDKDNPKDLIVTYKAKKRSDGTDFTKEFRITLKAKDYKIGEEAAQLENGTQELVLEEGDLAAAAKVASLKDIAEIDGLQGRTVKEITGGNDANGKNISTLLELVGNDIKVKAGETIKTPAGGIEATITIDGTDKFGRTIAGLDKHAIKIRFIPKPEAKVEHFALKDPATAFVTRSINAPDDIAEFNEVPDSLGRSVTAKVFDYNNVEKIPPVNLGLSFTGPKKNILKLDSGSVENGIVELTVSIGGKQEKIRLFINPTEIDRKLLAGGEKIDGVRTLVDQYAKALSIENFAVLPGASGSWEIVNDGFVTTVKKVGENLEIEEIAGTKMTFSGADVQLAYYCALQLNKIVASNNGKTFKTDGNTIEIKETNVLGVFPRPSWLVADDISKFPVSAPGAAQNFVSLLNFRAGKVNANAAEVIKLPEDKKEKFTVIQDLPISEFHASGDVKYSIDQGKTWVPVSAGAFTIKSEEIAKHTNAEKKLIVWVKASESGKIGAEKRYEYEIVPAYNTFEVSNDKSKLTLKHSDSAINTQMLNYSFSIASGLPGFKFDSIYGKYIRISIVEGTNVVSYGKLLIDEMTGNIGSSIYNLETGKASYTFNGESDASKNDRKITVTK